MYLRKKPLVLTPWFPATVNPVRKGMYEVGHSEYVHHHSKFKLTGTRRWWDGKSWRGGWVFDSPSIFGSHHTHQWRGVLRHSNRG